MQLLRHSSVFVLLLTAGLLGCDTTAVQPDSQVVVEAYLQADTTFDTVRLTRTVGATNAFDPTARAVTEDEVEVVEIQRLNGPDGGVDTTYSYVETGTAGVYEPESPPGSSPPVVEANTTYRLRVDLVEGPTVTATTTVPGALDLRAVRNTTPEMTAEYQNPDQKPAFVIDPPPSPSGRQNVYFFTVTSQLPKARLDSNFTPLYGDGYDADEDSIESFRVNSSPLLNQANFPQNADGTVTVDLPWVGVAFFGPNEVSINVVDDNYYDFIRSESAQDSAPPGEFPGIIEHVENGTGVFGSYASADVNIKFTGNEEFPAN
jgi:hypothetical protein